MTTRVTEGARQERYDKRAMRAVSLFSAWAAALVSCVSRLRRLTLARACTPLTKSEEKERLLAVYLYCGHFVPLVFMLRMCNLTKHDSCHC